MFWSALFARPSQAIHSEHMLDTTSMRERLEVTTSDWSNLHIMCLDRLLYSKVTVRPRERMNSRHFVVTVGLVLASMRRAR